MSFKKLLFVIKSEIQMVMHRIRETYALNEIRAKNPSCIIYNGVKIDNDSILGRYTVLFENATIISSKIGEHTYIQKGSEINNSEIGKFCSIAKGVTIGLAQHKITTVSSHPAFYMANSPIAHTYCKTCEDERPNKTIIKNDVWIGQNTLIMGGISIGTGVVIGAGSIVTKDIPDYAIAVGIPAKVIRFRFQENICKELLESKWWDFSEEKLIQYAPCFGNPVQFCKVVKTSIE